MTSARAFELRTYHAVPGRRDDLVARFRDHTIALFERHGLEVVGFWLPAGDQHADDQLVYVLAFPDRATAKERWTAFQADPEWVEVKRRSETNG
ncbi:MAG: NIPSNAP family protein, partial [Candidatus Dormibacteraceae bacterium]